MAKKSKLIKPKPLSPQDVKRARLVAAGLEASFTEPPPPGALAPAPLLDEIRELGPAGLAGMIEHLSATRGRIAALASIRALGDPAAVPGLLGHARSMRWSTEELAALGETVRALDPRADLPAELDREALGRAREAAARLSKPLSREGAEEVSDLLQSLPLPLREIALRETAEGEARPNGARAANLIALAEALAARGFPPPALLIEALASMATPGAAQVLSALAEAAPDKETGSRLRKALYRLRSLGVAAGESEEGAEEAERPASQKIDFAHALISAVDGSGRMMVWLARSLQPRGRYLVQAQLHRGRGIEDFVSADLSAKELRDVLSRIAEQPALATAEAPPAYAFWLLRRAQGENELAGEPLPAGFTRAMLMLEPLADPGAHPPRGGHPVRARVLPIPAGEPRLEPREMFAQKAFWSWVIDEGRIAPHFRQFLESLQSRVAVNDAQRRERLDQIVDEAAKALFGEADLRGRLGDQFEDNAYLFWVAGREDIARECVTLAEEMRAGGDPPAFFREMVHFTMSVLIERLLRQSRVAERGPEGPAQAPGEPPGEEGSSAIVTP